MTKVMKYKEYTGSINYSDEDKTFHGKILYINDLVSYESTNRKKLKKEFRISVDDYLEFCKENGKKPNTPKRR